MTARSRVIPVLAAFLLAACLPAEPGGERRVPLVRVIDGDTVVVRDGGRDVTVRIAGIDTPELHHPASRPQYLAREARQRLAALLGNGPVRLVPDGGRDRHDRYGRLLAYVETPDGRDAGAVLVREGLARVYRKFRVSRKERYLALEDEARRAGRGLWKEGGLAEVRWLLRRGEPAIRVLPMTGWRYAVVVPGWVRAGVSGRALTEALWAARRSLGARWNREHGRREGPDPAKILREAGFVSLAVAAADRAPGEPSPPEGRGPARRTPSRSNGR